MAENGSARPYVVLRHIDNGTDIWEQLAPVTATSAGQACRRAAEALDEAVLEQGVTLRAVPQRTWDASLTQLKLQRTTRLVAP